MKINFKQPRYVLPILILPFLCLFFYIYHSFMGKKALAVPEEKGIQVNVGGVSKEIEKKGLTDKLDAYRGAYKDANGYTAITPLDQDVSLTSPVSIPNQKDKNKLDSANQINHQYLVEKTAAGNHGNIVAENSSSGRHYKQSQQDQALADALSKLSSSGEHQGKPLLPSSTEKVKEKDPMDLFKSQMAYVDSVTKSADPQYQQEAKRQLAVTQAEELSKQHPKLKVSKSGSFSELFNTVLPEKTEAPITAIIDENVTGYAGSRLRIRLLEEITVGKFKVPSGTYLYAKITGFSDQRVMLAVHTILLENKILPVKLDLYDMDGLPGLFVPESAFREFTKDLGGNSMQGINIQGTASNQNQFVMSTVDKAFQSTSTAIANLIRKNKAKIKYSSYLYLIDAEELKKDQKSY